jgi:crossover junction endodeoxyribonuclease RusA
MSRWLSEQAIADHQARMRGLDRAPVSQRRSETVDTDAKVPRRLCLVLPFPPSANRTARHTNSGAHYTPREQIEFRNQVHTICLATRAPKLSGRLRVAITLFPPDRRRFDIDNRIKATLDALQKAGLYDDDEQIDQLEVTRVRDTKRGEAAVTVLEL